MSLISFKKTIYSILSVIIPGIIPYLVSEGEEGSIRNFFVENRPYFLMGAITIVVLILIFTILPACRDYIKIQKKYKKLQEENEKIKKENSKLSSKVHVNQAQIIGATTVMSVGRVIIDGDQPDLLLRGKGYSTVTGSSRLSDNTKFYCDEILKKYQVSLESDYIEAENYKDSGNVHLAAISYTRIFRKINNSINAVDLEEDIKKMERMVKDSKSAEISKEEFIQLIDEVESKIAILLTK